MNAHHTITRRFFTVLLASILTLIMASVASLWSEKSLANNRIKLPDIGNTANTIISSEVEKNWARLF
jgi:hypothetical protein